ncbi:hypothetical protein BOSEA31B_14889 [Hyphomicrobiales bacterium]|nr:hypothetical protein BOSEA31B_14889 [Hyphomicrobiales bacterium]CAI0345334.1 hypothetical protein BO1005MUT1_390006 [Hyphomicrobiales bacterium]
MGGASTNAAVRSLTQRKSLASCLV